ncbi:MAG: hypothetical protein GC191_14875 [Azospirillum sp.]|nr:hypothetical protein [Azospirillum sp.]
MIVDLFILVIVLGLVSWLVNKITEIEVATREARRRVRIAKVSENRLHATLDKLKDDEARLNKEIEELSQAGDELRQTQMNAKAALEAAKATRRPRFLILHERRNSGDREWVVTLTNATIAEVDASHPLGKEWLDGRDFLVFARTDEDAAQRAIRRFSARPGFAVKAVAPLPPGIF